MRPGPTLLSLALLLPSALLFSSALLCATGCSNSKSTAPAQPPPDAAAVAGVHCPDAPPPATRRADGTALDPEVAKALPPLWQGLATAMQSGQQVRVDEAVCLARKALGDWQGVAEQAASYRPVTGNTPAPEQTLRAMLEVLGAEVYGSKREQWRVGVDNGEALSEPLRVSCQLLQIYTKLAVLTTGEDAKTLDASARQAADWLISIQGANGVFPYPDMSSDGDAWLARCKAEGKQDAECAGALPRAYQLALRARDAWNAAGQPAGSLVNGWWVEISFVDPGGLQFDNGVCGRAMLDAYERFQEPAYLASAQAAGRWARDHSPVPNFNYNAFSVGLMARLDAVDPGKAWAEDALSKARLGVLPGALPDGRWLDPHNARIEYHQIILVNLALLATQLDDAWLDATLSAALSRSVQEIHDSGATAIDDGIEAHLVLRALGRDESNTLERLVEGGTKGTTPTAMGIGLWLATELAAQ